MRILAFIITALVWSSAAYGQTGGGSAGNFPGGSSTTTAINLTGCGLNCGIGALSNNLYFMVGGTPFFGISATQILWFGLAASAQANALCYNSGTGVMTYNSGQTSCAASALRFKDLIGFVDNATGIDALRPSVWTYRKDADMDERIHVGLLADDVLKMDSRCVTYDKDGGLLNYEDRCVLAYLVADRHKMRAELEDLRRRLP